MCISVVWFVVIILLMVVLPFIVVLILSDVGCSIIKCRRPLSDVMFMSVCPSSLSSRGFESMLLPGVLLLISRNFLIIVLSARIVFLRSSVMFSYFHCFVHWMACVRSFVVMVLFMVSGSNVKYTERYPSEVQYLSYVIIPASPSFEIAKSFTGISCSNCL